MKPTIVCLCGSTKFKEEYEKVNMEESLKGNIVLSVGCFAHHDKLNLRKEEKQGLDDLHKKKIDLADEIFVVNVKGYIGDSTKSEIKYAKELGKKIKYLEDPDWYGDGTEEELGEVQLEKGELEEFFKAIYKAFDTDKLKSDVIRQLEDEIGENNKRSIEVINILLTKLSELANAEHEKFKKKMPTDTVTAQVYATHIPTWASYFNTTEIREISDYVHDANSLLATDCLWSK